MASSDANALPDVYPDRDDHGWTPAVRALVGVQLRGDAQLAAVISTELPTARLRETVVLLAGITASLLSEPGDGWGSGCGSFDEVCDRWTRAAARMDGKLHGYDGYGPGPA